MTSRDDAARRLGYASDSERRRIQRLWARHGVPWQRGQRKPTSATIHRVESGRKPRDYKREEQQRNAKAQAAGYKNRYQVRKTKPSQHETQLAEYDKLNRLASNGELYNDDGTLIFFPIQEEVVYSPNAKWLAKYGIKRSDYITAYYNAFVNPNSYYLTHRHDEHPVALERYFDLIEPYMKDTYGKDWRNPYRGA